MNCTYKYLIAMAPLALSCGVVGGQESAIDAAAARMSQTELKAGDIRASNLLGAMVKRLSGDSIGQVDDLVVSADAEVRLAVISVGGVLGVGGKTIAIPFDQFTVAPDGSTLFLTISEQDLRALPAFDLEGDINALHSGAAQPAVLEEQTNTQLE